MSEATMSEANRERVWGRWVSRICDCGHALFLSVSSPCSTSPHLILGKGLDLLEEETGLVLGADVSHEAAAVWGGGVVWCV